MADRIRPPRMRMARRIKKGDIIKIKVKFNHPSFTGLGRVDPESEPSFNRANPVTFIRNMFVYYDDGQTKQWVATQPLGTKPVGNAKGRDLPPPPLCKTTEDRWEPVTCTELYSKESLGQRAV